jgi:hypothetical protein
MSWRCKSVYSIQIYCILQALTCAETRCTAGNVCVMQANGRPTCVLRNACSDIRCDACFICQNGACVRNNNDNSAACRNQQGVCVLQTLSCHVTLALQNTCATMRCGGQEECVERLGRATCVERSNGNGNGNGNWNGNGSCS